MTDPKLSETLALRNTLKSLQNKSDCDIRDITTWVTENLNYASELVTGEKGRSIGHSTSNYHFKVLSEAPVLHKPALVIYRTWHWNEPGPILPNVDAISTLSAGMALKVRQEDSSYFKADIILDLNEWQNMVPTIIRESLAFCVGKINCGDDDKKIRLKSLIAIRDHLYPEINLDKLTLAVDLGISDHTEDLSHWFYGEVTSASEANVTLPNELTPL